MVATGDTVGIRTLWPLPDATGEVLAVHADDRIDVRITLSCGTLAVEYGLHKIDPAAPVSRGWYEPLLET